MTCLVARVVVVTCACVTGACGKVGVANGPCGDDDACESGFVCDENARCVHTCAGNATANKKVELDCDRLPTAGCTRPNEISSSVAVCILTARTAKPGVLDAAYPCFDAIPTSTCTSDDPNALLDAANQCVRDVDACVNDQARAVCQDAADTCHSVGDDSFSLANCENDLEPGNDTLVADWNDCFGDNTDRCDDVELFCYESARNAGGFVVVVTP